MCPEGGHANTCQEDGHERIESIHVPPIKVGQTVGHCGDRRDAAQVWGEFFKGAVDDVRIYNRALAPSEIQSLMNTIVP